MLSVLFSLVIFECHPDAPECEVIEWEYDMTLEECESHPLYLWPGEYQSVTCIPQDVVDDY
jgi:hypothetical protein